MAMSKAEKRKELRRLSRKAGPLPSGLMAGSPRPASASTEACEVATSLVAPLPRVGAQLARITRLADQLTRLQELDTAKPRASRRLSHG